MRPRHIEVFNAAMLTGSVSAVDRRSAADKAGFEQGFKVAGVEVPA